MHSFKNYLVEEDRAVYFVFGRMNPPTIGHGKVLDKLSQLAGSNPYRMYLSQSQDAKKNPLNYKEKIKISRKMFPKHARSPYPRSSINRITTFGFPGTSLARTPSH